MIRAGKTKEIDWGQGEWIILDIGFSGKKKSCGLLFGDKEPEKYTFAKATEKILEYIKQATKPVNLVIEAPLSTAFTKDGNPTGRKMEISEDKKSQRYWYVGAGALVTLAALQFMHKLKNTKDKEIRLFEGFVSFGKGSPSDDKQDVNLLRKAIKDKDKDKIIDPSSFKREESDRIESIFIIMGMDIGIPPIIKRDKVITT